MLSLSIKLLRLRRIAKAAAVGFLLTAWFPSWATTFSFSPPEMGEYTEVIAAFQNPGTGDYYPEGAQDSYTGAILDTGASANMITAFTQGFSDPDLGDWPGLGLPIKGYDTTEITGVGGTGSASVSYPVTLRANSNWYMQQAIASGDSTANVNFAGFPAEHNTQMVVATLAGSSGASSDIVGMPFMSDKWTAIFPQDRVTSNYNVLLPLPSPYDGKTADVRFFKPGDPAAPPSAEWIDLWFPAGKHDNLDGPGDDPSAASSPRVENVGLGRGALTTSGKFVLDTGSPMTFISSEMALAIGIEPGVTPPDDTKTIGGVTGGSVDVPGYFIDTLSIPTTSGDLLDYNHVLVYVLDIRTSTGDLYTDGLLGSNLFFYGLGFESIFFDMRSGLLGRNHPDFTNAKELPYVIPEPPVVLLLLTGLILGGILARRRTA